MPAQFILIHRDSDAEPSTVKLTNIFEFYDTKQWQEIALNAKECLAVVLM